MTKASRLTLHPQWSAQHDGPMEKTAPTIVRMRGKDGCDRHKERRKVSVPGTRPLPLCAIETVSMSALHKAPFTHDGHSSRWHHFHKVFGNLPQALSRKRKREASQRMNASRSTSCEDGAKKLFQTILMWLYWLQGQYKPARMDHFTCGQGRDFVLTQQPCLYKVAAKSLRST